MRASWVIDMAIPNAIPFVLYICRSQQRHWQLRIWTSPLWDVPEKKRLDCREPRVDVWTGCQIKSFKFPDLLHLWCSSILEIPNTPLVSRFLTRQDKAVSWMESCPSIEVHRWLNCKIPTNLTKSLFFSTMQQTHVLFLGRLISRF